jgi:polyadenylation factor subunit 2
MSHEIVLFGKGKGKGTVDPKQFARRTIDYGSNVVRWLESSLARCLQERRFQCHYSFTKELLPPFATPQSPYDAICCRFVQSATTKNRSPVNCVHWFPNGRRLISGSQTGELTIWNGFQFHFENILQAHNAAVKAMEWTPEETVLVTGDQLGVIKFWDQYLYNFQTFQAHKESMCDLSIAPTGLKFVSCADDSHAKVWDLRTGEEERAFTGHGWDVRCCCWHPTKGLVATGSRDAQIKLWDPRAGEAITTIFCHKNTVTRVKWSPDGQFLASGSRDQLVMLMDIRTMSVRKVFKAHQKEVSSLCWHPETAALLASGGYDSHLHFWDAYGAADPIKSVLAAHEGPIWSLAWHPLGHLLVSGSHDYSTRFWSRARPGDKDFDELLPKKIAAPGDIPLSAIPPPPVIPMTVLDAGVFAGPPPKEAPLLHKLEGPKPAEAAEIKLGLTLGEGENRKEILDTSDFDAEDGQPPALAIADGAKPDAKPDDAKPEAKAEAKAEAKQAESKTGAKPPETEAGATHPDADAGAKLADSSADGKAGETKPDSAKLADTKVDPKSVETKAEGASTPATAPVEPKAFTKAAAASSPPASDANKAEGASSATAAPVESKAFTKAAAAKLPPASDATKASPPSVTGIPAPKKAETSPALLAAAKSAGVSEDAGNSTKRAAPTETGCGDAEAGAKKPRTAEQDADTGVDNEAKAMQD